MNSYIVGICIGLILFNAVYINVMAWEGWKNEEEYRY